MIIIFIYTVTLVKCQTEGLLAEKVQSHIQSMWPAAVCRRETERHKRVLWDRSQTQREVCRSAATSLFHETCCECSVPKGNKAYRDVATRVKMIRFKLLKGRLTESGCSKHTQCVLAQKRCIHILYLHVHTLLLLHAWHISNLQLHICRERHSPATYIHSDSSHVFAVPLAPLRVPKQQTGFYLCGNEGGGGRQWHHSPWERACDATVGLTLVRRGR